MNVRMLATAAVLLGASAAGPAGAQGGAPPARNSVFLELLGNGGAYSVNFDRRLSDGAAVRVGVATWTSDDLFGGEEARKTFVTVPVGASWLFGSGNSRVEVGAGVLVGRQTQDAPFEDGSTSTAIASLTGTAGYRYQRAAGGFLFRAGFTPFFGLGGDEAYPDRGFMPSGGISAGYTF